MVPYEQNQSFTGRDSFLEELHNQLQNPNTDQHRGRIALFGLRGIGKTQITLEYVYRYQNSYQRIYWISGNTQALLLDGYQKLGQRAELHISDLSAVQIAERVIAWLESEESWLLVVNNVDNLTVLSGPQNPNSKFLLLPSTGKSRQNTLITTRNRYADGIPAQAKEVEKLGRDASLALLYKFSKITPSDFAEEQAAAIIVEKLDHLPLAINQAAAYIREG